MKSKSIRIVCEADNSNAATMYLFGIIGDDLSALDFVSQLNELAETNDTIVIHINSGGGSIFDGLSMFEAIKQCKAKTIGRIEGICASMATILACAMDECYMSRQSQYMTHKPSGGVWGSANEMKTYASMMDNLELVLANVYMVKTGLTADEVKSKFLRSEDTWFGADQALAAKLIDGVFDSAISDTLTIPKVKVQKELVALYNSHLKIHNVNMKQYILTAPQMAALKLVSDASQTTVSAAIDDLVAKAANADLLQVQVNNLTTAKTNAETELQNYKTSQNKARVDASLKKAVDEDKKITVETANMLRAQFGDKPEDLDKFLATLSPIASISKELKTGGDNKKFDKTWDELDREGLLEQLKAEAPDLYEAKYKETFKKK